MTAVSNRAAAWRNLMVAAINAALDRELIGLEPGANHWPAPVTDGRYGSHVFPFVFPAMGGLDAMASLRDAGLGEVSVHAALLPTPRAAEFVPTWNAGFHAGQAFACGWLTRHKGCRLQDTTVLFRCRKRLLHILAEAGAHPNGFAPHGRVML